MTSPEDLNHSTNRSRQPYFSVDIFVIRNGLIYRVIIFGFNSLTVPELIFGTMIQAFVNAQYFGTMIWAFFLSCVCVLIMLFGTIFLFKLCVCIKNLNALHIWWSFINLLFCINYLCCIWSTFSIRYWNLSVLNALIRSVWFCFVLSKP